MPLKITQTQRQTQRLILTPYLKQALHIFQLPVMELRQFLQEKITENPLLEESDTDAEGEEEQELFEDKTIDEFLHLDNNLDDYFPINGIQTSDEEEERRRFKESCVTKLPTLQEHLLRQLRLLEVSSVENKIAEFIIGNIDNNGYLQIEIEEVARELKVGTEAIENVLSIIQGFDPAGVGARNLKECLLIQLQQKPNPRSSTATRIIKDCLFELKNRRYATIARKLKLSLEEVKKAKEEILKLDPKPGKKLWRRKNELHYP